MHSKHPALLGDLKSRGGIMPEYVDYKSGKAIEAKKEFSFAGGKIVFKKRPSVALESSTD